MVDLNRNMLIIIGNGLNIDLDTWQQNLREWLIRIGAQYHYSSGKYQLSTP